ncbi:hypothetical protein [Wenyingzhuangia sp. IMCC45574]
MRNTEEIRVLVQEHIGQIKISEFVSDGGWPNLNNIELAVFDQQVNNNEEVVKLHILYTIDRAGCCFIPGKEEQKRLPKKVIIKNNNIKFESYE